MPVHRFSLASTAVLLLNSSLTAAVMAPMTQVGPQPRVVDQRAYQHVIRVAPSEKHQTVGSAVAAISDASPTNRYAVFVAAGAYRQARLVMKPYVDLYGGFVAGEWRDRDVYTHATILDAQQQGPVVIAADNARLDGFVITGGQQQGHGGGIVCDGVSPTIANNIIVGNRTLKPVIGEGLGKQIASEGAGIALLAGSRAYVSNNLICENTTEIGNGAGITIRGHVQAKILRNVFCNNVAGSKDDAMFHGKVGSRSSPGGAISCSDESSPQISFNVIVMCSAPINNDAGGIWVEGNSLPPINYNWIVGNTSGDDGGGIYVMGNLYYDDQGVRHDAAPDGSVSVEDNLIAGNDTVRGGPGGVRASRWGRVDLRRNVIVGNAKGGAHGAEGGVICVMENNVMADNGLKNKPATPKFRLTGDIIAQKFDPARFVTEIKTSKDFGKEDLAGSAVRVGGKWSVVKSSAPGSLVLWGKLPEQPANFEVLDYYVPKEAQ
jgi:parallel beta helix pectate lyase-like protein